MLLHILTTALPVFAALFVGVLCRKKQLLDRAAVSTLKRLALDVALPFMIFPAFASADYSRKQLVIPLLMFTVCLTALGLGFAFKRIFHQKSRLMPFLMTGFESGMLGYSLFALLFPNESSANYAFVDLANGLFIFTVFKSLVMGGKGSFKEIVKEAFRSPVLWSILAGVFVGATGIYSALAPSGTVEVIEAVCSFVGAPTSCLILLTIGYDLELRSINWRRTLSYTAMRAAIMGIMLALLLFLNRRVLGGLFHEGALMLILITPASYSTTIFADVEEDRADIASTLSVMTLLTLILFAVLAAVVQ